MVIEEEESWFMGANETERMDLVSRFTNLILLLNKDAQSPCCPHNSTGMHVFEATEAKPIRPD